MYKRKRRPLPSHNTWNAIGVGEIEPELARYCTWAEGVKENLEEVRFVYHCSDLGYYWESYGFE